MTAYIQLPAPEINRRTLLAFLMATLGGDACKGLFCGSTWYMELPATGIPTNLIANVPTAPANPIVASNH